MRHIIAPVLIALLSACATMHGPQTITVSTTEIESRIQADLGGVVGMFKGIDLTQVRIEDVTLAGLPRFLGLARLADRKGMTLPDPPLMALPADRLRQSDVAYEATGVGVGFAGLNVDIAPR